MTDKPKTTAPAQPKAADNAPGRSLKPVDEVRGVITALAPQFKAALPAHIAVDKFQRVAVTAIAQSPDLLAADRNSLYAACMKCAQDGLLPDGREAALVTFNAKVGENKWEKRVQYMPMIAGILKKIRNSGELKELSVHAVFANDFFDYWIDDDGEHLKHRPYIDGPRGEFRLVYAMATTLQSGRYVEVMNKDQVDEVRAISKTKDKGPWQDWYSEMARKTVLRRLSKRLPMSTDIDDLIRRDDELYDLNAQRETATVIDPPQTEARRPRRLQSVVDADKPQSQPTPNTAPAPSSDAPPPGHPAADTPPDQSESADPAERI